MEGEYICKQLCLKERMAEREGFEPPVPAMGTADFESAAFDLSAISPHDLSAMSAFFFLILLPMLICIRMRRHVQEDPQVSSPSLPEECAHVPAAVVSEDALHDLDPVVVSRVVKDLEQGTDRTRLGIPCAEDEGLDPSVQTRARTHQAGLQRDEELCPREAVVAHRAGRITERHDFRVGGRVPAPGRLIVPPPDDLSLPDHESADRHLAELLRPPGQAQGLPHVSLEQRQVVWGCFLHGNPLLIRFCIAQKLGPGRPIVPPGPNLKNRPEDSVLDTARSRRLRAICGLDLFGSVGLLNRCTSRGPSSPGAVRPGNMAGWMS